MTKWIIAAVVAIIVVGGGSYLIFHKSSNNPGSSSSTSNYSSNSSSQNPPASSNTSSSIIQTKTDANVGQYLADANGNALYTYGADTAGVSNCSGACVASWPVYAPTSSSASLPTNVTVIKRSDGSSQYAYKGMPLYTFSADSAGHVTGNNVANFHIAKP
jgi:predicted lipoprotein with Yx(FWY)xxD motif